MILYNANVATMDPTNPRASLVAIENGRIAFVGTEKDGFAFPRRGHQIRVVDCRGGTVLPGFHDAHIHLDGMASLEMSLDCSSSNAGAIRAIQTLIADRAKNTPPGQWIRGRGYHEMNLVDARHPTRYDLDFCAPDNPVKLTHQSGHASVVNSLALTLLGIDEETLDLPGGVIERNSGSNIPNGVLLEMEDWLSQQVPAISYEDWVKSIRSSKDKLLARGVTSFQDATVTNDLTDWRTFRAIVDSIGPPLRGTFMLGNAVGKDAGAIYNDYSGQHSPRLGHMKVMVTATGGSIYPELPDIVDLFEQSNLLGIPLAVHVVELEAVAAVLEALRRAGIESPRRFFAPHRFEHCPESPDWVIDGLKSLGIAVVVNPGFIYYSGDRYLRTIPEDGLENLYPLRSMENAQLTLAAGSDSPVVPVDPIKSIYGAVFRRTLGGSLLNSTQSVSVTSAIRMHTTGAAKVTGVEDSLGSLMFGKNADLVILSGDPWAIEESDWENLEVRASIINGEMLWSRGMD